MGMKRGTSLELLNNKGIRFLMSLLLSAVLFVGLTFVSSMIIAKTNISENIGSLLMICISAISSMLFTALLTATLGIKGIFSTLIALVTVLFIKAVLTICITGIIKMTMQGIITILFTAVFCFVGAILGAYMKK